MLSDRQRSIVECIDRLGVDHEDIAEELDLSPSTVRSQIERMCAKFRCRPEHLPMVTHAVESLRSEEAS